MHRHLTDPEAATVILADGRTFIGEAVYDGRSVGFIGRQRKVIYSDGVDCRIEFGKLVERLFPLRLVREVRWNA